MRVAFEAAGAVVMGYAMNATVSIGIADGRARACNIETLLARADTALYSAKQAGRNRVVCAPKEVKPSTDAGKPEATCGRRPFPRR